MPELLISTMSPTLMVGRPAGLRPLICAVVGCNGSNKLLFPLRIEWLVTLLSTVDVPEGLLLCVKVYV